VSRLDRYILWQILAVFGFFSLVLVGVYWINRAAILFDTLVADGEGVGVFVEFSLLTLPNVIRLVLPYAAFAAAVFVGNRLSNESERVVMQSTGFSPVQLCRPVLAFGVIVALLMSVLVHVLVPVSRGELADRSAQIAQNVTTRLLKPGTFQHPAPGLTVFIGAITPEGRLENVFLSDMRAPTNQTTFTARQALLTPSSTGPKLILLNGFAQTLRAPDGRLFTTSFSDMTYDLGAILAVAPRTDRRLAEMATPRLMFPKAADLARFGGTSSELWQEVHARFSQVSFAAVTGILGFSALLLGGFSRFGLWRQISGAIALLVLCQLGGNATRSLVLKDPSLWILHYTPAILGAVCTIGVLWLARRPQSPTPQTIPNKGLAI
jgi:lipopolysaccharide export system permease protein